MGEQSGTRSHDTDPPPTEHERGANLPRLVDVMRTLLGPDGCPWDKAQTLESLRPYVVEEAFEVVDAIDRGAPAALREELGDLLLQVVFQAELARTKGWFTLGDVVAGIAEKMVRRHPWVFGDEKLTAGENAADASIARWEEQKAKEKAARGRLGGVPVALPALLRALRIGEKAAAVGYDWPDAKGARAKVDEELRELDEAVREDQDARAEEELGDVLFALASYARKRGMDPEAALRGTLDRFTRRFRHAEQAAEAKGTSLSALDAEALDTLWNAAKDADRGA